MPTVVVVRSDEVEAALAPLAETLGFELARADKLPMLDAARRSLERSLGGRSGTKGSKPRGRN